MFSFPNSAVYGVSATHSNRILCVSKDGGIYLLHSETQTSELLFQTNMSLYALCTAGNLLFVGGGDYQTHCFAFNKSFPIIASSETDISTPPQIVQIGVMEGNIGRVWSLTLCEPAQWLAAGSDDVEQSLQCDVGWSEFVFVCFSRVFNAEFEVFEVLGGENGTRSPCSSLQCQ